MIEFIVIERVDVKCEGCGFTVSVGTQEAIKYDRDRKAYNESPEEAAMITLQQFDWTRICVDTNVFPLYEEFCPTCSKKRGYIPR